MNTLREYIQKRQEELGLTQNQLALRAGKTSGWLSKYLSGERKEMKIDALIALSAALQVPESKLIAAYKGQNPDGDEACDSSKQILDEILQVMLKNINPRVFAEALLAHDGPEKVQEYLAEAKRRNAERKKQKEQSEG